MSLINQMLQDLDKRSADGTGSATIHDHVRAVPAQNQVRAKWWIALVMILGVAGGGAWFWLHSKPSVVPVASHTVEPVPAPIMKSEQLLSAPPSATQKKEVTPAVNVDVPTPQTLLATPAKPDSANGLSAHKPKEIVPAGAPEKETESSVKAPALTAANNISPNINKQMKELTPPQRAENEYRKAVALMQQGRVIEAIAGLEQAIQNDPAHAAARQTLVALLIDSKRQDEAVRKLQDGLSLDPSQTGMAMLLARLQVERGDVHGGVETLQRSLSYASERADYRAFLAALQQREGRHKEAIDNYSVAVRKSPQTGVWWMGMGISLQAENRGADAQEAFNRAKATNSLTPELLAFVEQKLKQLQH